MQVPAGISVTAMSLIPDKSGSWDGCGVKESVFQDVLPPALSPNSGREREALLPNQVSIKFVFS